MAFRRRGAHNTRQSVVHREAHSGRNMVWRARPGMGGCGSHAGNCMSERKGWVAGGGAVQESERGALSCPEAQS